MTQKKLLMIINPRAGRTKPMDPMFDACAIFSDAGYLLSVRKTAGMAGESLHHIPNPESQERGLSAVAVLLYPV